MFVAQLHWEGQFGGIRGRWIRGHRDRNQCHAGVAVGVPKLMLSTMASGDTSPYGAEHHDDGVGDRYRRGQLGLGTILANAAAAMAGMVKKAPVSLDDQRLLIAADVRRHLGSHGSAPGPGAPRYEVLVFHCTGTGGKAMESLVDAGFFDEVPRSDDDGAV